MLSKKQIKEIALETLKQLEQEKNKKSEIFYLDNNDKIVPIELATKYIIREYDGHNNEIIEMFGEINKNNTNTK